MAPCGTNRPAGRSTIKFDSVRIAKVENEKEAKIKAKGQGVEALERRQTDARERARHSAGMEMIVQGVQQETA